MANEITVQGGLTLQRSPMTLQAAESVLRNQTGTRGLVINPLAPVSGDAAGILISIGFNMGFLYVKNLDPSVHPASVDVELSIVAFNAGGGAQIFARLRSGEFCVVPLANLSRSQFYARSTHASTTVSLQVVATEL